VFVTEGAPKQGRDTPLFLAHLDELRSRLRRYRKIHVICDSAKCHTSEAVAIYLWEHLDRIELHFLPAYSPELNPDELVNADLKRSLPMHSRARDQAQLAAETRRFFHRRQREPHIVRGYFGGPHVRYTLE
jgi:transposase